MKDTQLFLGIDGGGSHTRALAINASGAVVGRGSGGPSNPNQVGWDGLERAFAEAIRGCGEGRRFAGIHAGVAGVANETARERIRAIVASTGIAEAGNVSVSHDLEIALAGGLSGRPGIVLVAGTGSACFGKNRKGDTWQAGGWGPILDDAGGGYWLGLRAIIAAIRAEDGRGPATILGAAVCEATGSDSLRKVLGKLHDGSLSRPAVAALAPLVLKAAAKRDMSAMVVLSLGISELTLMVATVVGQLSLKDESAEIVITGGVGGSEGVRPHLEAAIVKRVPGARFTKPELSAVAGAVILATRRVPGIDPSASLRIAEC